MSKPIVEKIDRNYIERLRQKLSEVAIAKYNKGCSGNVRVFRKEQKELITKANKLRIKYHDADRSYHDAKRELQVVCRKAKVFLVEKMTKRGTQLSVSSKDPYLYHPRNYNHLWKQVNDLVFEFETAVRGGKDFNDAMKELNKKAKSVK